MIEMLVDAAMAQGFSCGLDHPVAEARARFNEAIADGKPGPIKRILTEDVIIVTGSDSGVIAGREAQLDVWKSDFSNPSRLIYVRTPRCIAVSEVEPIATELGTWVGKPKTPDGSEVGGDYTAKWREVGGTWRLEAEIFTTMRERQALSL